MHWLEVAVDVDAEAAEVVAETLRPFAHGGVAIEQVGGPLAADADVDGWEPGTPETARFTVRIYLPDPGGPGGESTAQRRQQIAEALYHLNRIYPVSPPVFRTVSDEDWAQAWKQHYGIFRVGRRCVIRPDWLEYAPEPGDLVITLDPGMAFGTGLHPSTQLCLMMLEDTLRGGEQVLDMGTGSGILAIGAAGLGADHVDAVDNDPVAVESAQRNVAANGLADRIWVGAEPRSGPTYDVIVVNILARVIVELLGAGLAGCLRPGGVLIASGIIDTQAGDVVQALAGAGVTVTERRQITDWVALAGRKARGTE